MTTCKKCSRSIPADSLFCPFCGTKVIALNSPSPSSPSPRNFFEKKRLEETPRKAFSSAPKESIPAPTSGTPETLLTRAFLFLEDGLFSRAEQYLEIVLDQDPENAKAYLGKLMVDLEVSTVDQLKDCPYPFDQNRNYVKALRFAGKELADVLLDSISHIDERNHLEQLQKQYNNAVHAMNRALTEAEFVSASKLLSALGEYQNSAELAQICQKKATDAKASEIYRTASEYMRGEASIPLLEKAISLFESIPEWEDSLEQVQLCRERIKQQQHFNEEFHAMVQSKEKQKRSIARKIIMVLALTILIPFIVLAIIYYASYSSWNQKQSQPKQEAETNPYSYEISVFSNHSSQGTVIGEGTYLYGDSVSIKATPSASYQFISWSDGDTSALRTVSATGDVQYKAFFARKSSTNSNEARIGNQFYKSFRNAVLDAKDGQTIVLLRNISISEEIPIYKKSVIIDGNNYTITQSQSSPCFSIYGNGPSHTVILRNLFLQNKWEGSERNYCVLINGSQVAVAIENCHFMTQGEAIHLTSSSSATKQLYLRNSCVVSKNIALSILGNATVNIQNSAISGKYCVYSESTSAINISDSDFFCYGSVILGINSDNVVSTIKDSRLNLAGASTAAYIAYVYNDSRNCSVTVSGNKTIANLKNSAIFGGSNDSSCSYQITGGKFSSPSVSACLSKKHKAISENGMWIVTQK